MITRPQMHFSLKHKTPSIIVIIKWTHCCNFVRKRTRNKELLYPGSTMGSNHRAEFSSQPFSRSNGAPSRCTSLPRQRRRHGRHDGKRRSNWKSDISRTTKRHGTKRHSYCCKDHCRCPLW